MSNNDNFQLFSKENNKNEKGKIENQNNLQKKKTRNKISIKNDDEIKVELIMKNNKTESTADKTKNNDLILPKIENNNTLKQTHENDINYLSQTKEISDKNYKENENKKLLISNENNINIDKTNNKSIEDKEININLEVENYLTEEERLIEIFNRNKKNLMQVCLEIEENLNNIYNYNIKSEDNNAMNKTQHNNNFKPKISKEEKEILKKINNYKIRIKSAQNELDIQLKINKADELENILQERKLYLEKIQKENSVLNRMKTLQKKDQKDVKDILNKKEELYSVNEKIIKMKDEAKIKKDYNHTLSEKIKNQNEQINSLQNKCNLINQNIEYYKKKQIHSIKKQNEADENNNNSIENLDINEIKNIYEDKIEIIYKKQVKIKSKIKEQNTKIKEITNYNDKLSIQIEQLMAKIKDNMNKIMTFENELKRKEILLYDSINKKKNTIPDRQPFHIGPINFKQKEKNKKIFNYQKYLKEFEKNKNRIKLYSSVDMNRKPQTLKEIEKLKNDIQLAIKKNDLDEKINKIILSLKNKKNNDNKNINKEEDDVLNNLFKRNEEINGSNRYDFYVTEGANLPVPLKQENINNHLNSNC